MKQFKDCLNAWWFSDTDALPLGVVRIAFSVLFLSYIVLMAPDRYAFFMEPGIVPTSLASSGAGPQLLRFANSGQVDFVLGLSIFAGGFLLIGLWSRASAWLVWLCLMSFQGRDPLVHTGADVVMRLLAFYLAVSPAGAALSWDCHSKYKAWTSTISAWPLRLMQLQVAAIYGQTFMMKLTGDKWQTGTALHYILNLTDYARFPWPHALDTPLVMCLLSWSVLALEVSLSVLIWFPAWRLRLLAGAVVLHLGIDWALTISMFSGAMLVLLGCFVTADEYRAFAVRCREAWLGRREFNLGRSVRTWPPGRAAYDLMQYAFHGELQETRPVMANRQKIKASRGND